MPVSGTSLTAHWSIDSLMICSCWVRSTWQFLMGLTSQLTFQERERGREGERAVAFSLSTSRVWWADLSLVLRAAGQRLDKTMDVGEEKLSISQQGYLRLLREDTNQKILLYAPQDKLSSDFLWVTQGFFQKVWKEWFVLVQNISKCMHSCFIIWIFLKKSWVSTVLYKSKLVFPMNLLKCLLYN